MIKKISVLVLAFGLFAGLKAPKKSVQFASAGDYAPATVPGQFSEPYKFPKARTEERDVEVSKDDIYSRGARDLYLKRHVAGNPVFEKTENPQIPVTGRRSKTPKVPEGWATFQGDPMAASPERSRLALLAAQQQAQRQAEFVPEEKYGVAVDEEEKTRTSPRRGKVTERVPAGPYVYAPGAAPKDTTFDPSQHSAFFTTGGRPDQRTARDKSLGHPLYEGSNFGGLYSPGFDPSTARSAFRRRSATEMLQLGVDSEMSDLRKTVQAEQDAFDQIRVQAEQAMDDMFRRLSPDDKINFLRNNPAKLESEIAAVKSEIYDIEARLDDYEITPGREKSLNNELGKQETYLQQLKELRRPPAVEPEPVRPRPPEVPTSGFRRSIYG